MFSGADWTTVSTGVGVVLAVLAGGTKLWKTVEKNDPNLIKELPHVAVEVVDDAAKFVAHIVESPVLAPLVAKGKLEAHHLLDEISHDKAVIQAETILRKAGASYADLSPELKVKAESLLKLGLLKVGITYSDAQVRAIFADVDAAAKALEDDATFKALLGAESPVQTTA